MKKGRDHHQPTGLTTQLSRVLYTQHKMRHFLNSTLKQGGRFCCQQLSNDPLAPEECETDNGETDLRGKHKLKIPAAIPVQCCPERDVLVHETSIQAIPPHCSRLWFTCVLCRQNVHSTQLHFIRNVGVARPWITTCPKCHVAIVAAQGG